MGNLFRKKKMASRINERKFPFIVQLAVPDGGFGPTLDAINAWHCYSNNRQRRGHRQHLGDQHFWRWCFESVEVAERIPAAFRRRDRASGDRAAGRAGPRIQTAS